MEQFWKTLVRNCNTIRSFSMYYLWYPPKDTDPLWLISQEFHDTAKILGMTVMKQTLRVHLHPIPTKATHPQPVRNYYHSSSAVRHDYHLACNPVTRDTEFIPRFPHYFKPLCFTQMATGHCLPTQIPINTYKHYFLQAKIKQC